MNGIAGFLANGTGRYLEETVAALDAIGCPGEAQKLRKILTLASAAGLTLESAQNELYVDETGDALDVMEAITDEFDFGAVTKAMEDYADTHRERLIAALAAS